jgi:serine/threonine-protein kinase CTR1
MKEIAGTPQYMAPEVFKRWNYDEKVDVWSYGMVVWALFSEKKPFPTLRNDNDNQKEHFEKLIEDEGYRPEIPQEWQVDEKLKKISEMMKRCWNSVKPTERPSFEEICETLVEMDR